MHPVETRRILVRRLHIDGSTLHKVLLSKNDDGTVNIKPFTNELHSTPYLNNARIEGFTVTDLDIPTISYTLV